MKQVVFSLMVSLVFLIGIPVVGIAGDVNINIGVAPPPLPPPPVVVAPEALPPEQFAEPPDVVAIPSGTATVYMVPNTAGLYFYNDYWYRFRGGYWYRSAIYNGSWTYVATPVVPQVIMAVPPEYVLYLPPRYPRIHYYDLHQHWREWDRSRYWQRYDWYKHELRNDVRRDRYKRIETERKKHPQIEGRKPPPGDMRKPKGEGHKPPHEQKEKEGQDRHQREQR
jgi:hypothetical protein